MKFLKNSAFYHLIFIFLLTLAVTSVFSVIGIDPHHDGIMLKPAIDVANGKTLFKETFTIYGALTVFIQALALKIFGPYLIVIRLLTAFFYALTSVFLWLIWSKFLTRNLSTIACLIWLFLAPYYFSIFFPWASVYALLFQCVCLYLVLLFCKTKRINLLFFAGIFTSLAFWSRQPVGIVVFLAIIVFLVLITYKKILSLKLFLKSITVFFFGFLIVNLFFLIWLIFNNAFQDWFLQSIRTAYIVGRIIGKNYSLVDILAAYFPNLIWILFPIIVFILLLISLKSLSKKPDLKLLIASLICFFSFHQYYPVTTFDHVYWAASPSIGLCLYFVLEYLIKKNSKKISIIFKILMLIFVFAFIISLINEISYRIFQGFYKVTKKYVEIDSPLILQKMRLEKPDAIFYSDLSSMITSYFQQNPEKRFLILSEDALYATLTDKAISIGPLYANFDGATSGIYRNYSYKIDSFIELNKPLLLIDRKGIIKGYKEIKNWKERKIILAEPIPDSL